MFIYLTGHYKNLDNIIGFRAEVMVDESVQHVLNRILRMDSNRFSNELKFSIENYWYNYGFLVNSRPVDFQKNPALKDTTIHHIMPLESLFTKIEYRDYMIQMISCESKPDSNDPNIIFH